jgi:hypothetical protein
MSEDKILKYNDDELIKKGDEILIKELGISGYRRYLRLHRFNNNGYLEYNFPINNLIN